MRKMKLVLSTAAALLMATSAYATQGPVNGADGIDIVFPMAGQCYWTARTQSADTETLKMDLLGSNIIDVSGTGTGYNEIGSGKFAVGSGDTATVTITSSSGKQDVIHDSHPLTVGGENFIVVKNFGLEDSSDNDWQDLFFQITCFHKSG